MSSESARHEADDDRRYAGCAIPPIVHSVGFGWDPQPEVNRLLFLAKEAGADVHSGLELGCGTGRLLECLCESLDEVVALDLSPAVVDFARTRSRATIEVGDMSDFALGRRFDLIFTSANTIRHVCDEGAISGMWRCIGDHLSRGGVFIADLELGIADEAERLNKPVRWEIARGSMQVRVSWEVIGPPSAAAALTTIRWTFESRGGECEGVWSEVYRLRACDAPQFVAGAEAHGGLRCCGVYEPRDPYLIGMPVKKAVGRTIVVLQSTR